MIDAERPRETGWRAWVLKAEGDFLCIENNVSAAHVPWDAVAFHAQQGVEKLLTALLVNRNLRPPRTHDLVALLALCAEGVPSLARFEPDCEQLTIRAVRSRYPDDREETTEADARDLVARAHRMRDSLLSLMS